MSKVVDGSSKIVVCIVCPRGCEMRVEVGDPGKSGASDGQVLRVEGAACARGRAYAAAELRDPRRTLSTSIRVLGGEEPLTSVRLTGAIPIGRVGDAMQVLRAVRADAPILMGQVVLADVAGLGVDAIATRENHVRRQD
jgi:CxxC motif-containing protein